MKAIIQRVNQAHVIEDSVIIGKISKGLLIFVGVEDSDNDNTIIKISDKIINLRIFNDINNKMNLSLIDVGGSVLIISQFTLYGDCSKGNRPSFIKAASPVHAKKIYNEFVNYMVQQNINVQSGKFGANMKVQLINDGPATFILNI